MSLTPSFSVLQTIRSINIFIFLLPVFLFLAKLIKFVYAMDYGIAHYVSSCAPLPPPCCAPPTFFVHPFGGVAEGSGDTGGRSPREKNCNTHAQCHRAISSSLCTVQVISYWIYKF
jgi:hypothetical protein